MRPSRTALGASGEEAVAAWYAANGYRVVARNWRCRDGELDIVARRGPLVVFCEVKTRSSLAFGAPVEAVGPQKQRRIRRLAARWLQEHEERSQAGAPPRDIRFDVACVLGADVDVIEAAF